MKDTDEPIGNLLMDRYDEKMKSLEISVNLHPNYWRKCYMTEAKLERENIRGEKESNNAHFIVGKNVREAIKKNGSTMPEELPHPEKSLKELK